MLNAGSPDRHFYLKQHYAAMKISLPWHPRLQQVPEGDRATFLGFMAAVLIMCQVTANDGRFPKHQVYAVGPFSAADVDRAVEVGQTAGFLIDDGDFWIWHDYGQWNNTCAERAEISAKARKSGKSGGEARAANASKDTEPNPDKHEIDDAILFFNNRVSGMGLGESERHELKMRAQMRENGAQELRDHALQLGKALDGDKSLQAETLVRDYLRDPASTLATV